MHKPKQSAIIIDLDGTLCNTAHRQHHMKSKPKNWPAFYAGITQDTPNKWCRDLLFDMYSNNYDMSFIFVSGRPDDYRDATWEWLDKHIHCFPSQAKLFMRKSGDYRQDAIVKTEIYHEFIAPNYEVQFCIDDRKQVVDAWRALGLVCLQCAPGEF